MSGKIVRFFDRFRRTAGRPEPAAPYSIEDGWRDHFAPVVRNAGFKGSGRHFRRVTEGFVETIGLQGSRSGGKFAVNLGLQPLTIPDVMGNQIDPGKLKEIDCEFRQRLTEGGADQWWKYTSQKSTIEAAAKAAAHLFETRALAIFSRMTKPPSPLMSIDPNSFESGKYDFSGFGSTKVRMARALSLLRKAQCDLPASRAFARIALNNVGHATALRTELAELADAN